MARGKYITADKVRAVKGFYRECPGSRTAYAAELFDISQSSVQAINRGEYDKLLQGDGEQLMFEDIDDRKHDEQERCRLNLKLSPDCKSYLKEAAHQCRMSMTSYLVGLVEADMELHPDWHEPEPDTAESLVLELYDYISACDSTSDETIGSYYARLVNAGIIGNECKEK